LYPVELQQGQAGQYLVTEVVAVNKKITNTLKFVYCMACTCVYLSACSRVDFSDHEAIFKKYVCDQIPPSVKIVTVSGADSIAGAEVTIIFDISPMELHKLIADKGFIELSQQDANNVSLDDRILSASKCGVIMDAAFIIKTGPDDLGYCLLLINKEKNKVYFRFFRA
jgi:hypothetical protein